MKLLFTSFDHFETNLLTHSHQPSSQLQRTFIKTFLFNCLNHCETNLLTHSQQPSSHRQRTFNIKLLFTSFDHFETNLLTHSHHPSSPRRRFGLNTCVTNQLFIHKHAFNLLLLLSHITIYYVLNEQR